MTMSSFHMTMSHAALPYLLCWQGETLDEDVKELTLHMEKFFARDYPKGEALLDSPPHLLIVYSSFPCVLW